jgi:hypothetical protein
MVSIAKFVHRLTLVRQNVTVGFAVKLASAAPCATIWTSAAPCVVPLVFWVDNAPKQPDMI